MMPRAWLKTRVVAVLLTTSTAPGINWAVEVYIPRTSEHFKCKFRDGSYTEYKAREKWYFYAEPIPHAQTRAPLDSMMKYVDTKGKTHKGAGTANPQCEGVGKREGRIFFDGGFENLKGQIVLWESQVDDVIPPRWEDFPKKIPGGTVDQSREIRNFMEKEDLYGGNRALVVVLTSERTLLYEQPLTTLRHPSWPFNTVLYVYQSISTDYGRTWSTPVITKEAKLFEVGRGLTEQSWSPKVQTLVKHR